MVPRRLPFRARVALLLGAVVLLCGGALLWAAHALMAQHLQRTLSPAVADVTSDELRGQFLLVLAGATLGAGVLGWLVADRALRPLRRLADAAAPAPVLAPGARGARDELRAVADDLDGMLDRLGLAFAAQRRFVGHAAHELRRPLTAMRTELDVTLSDPDADATELRRMAAELSDAVDRCSALVTSLLTLAQGEAVAVGDDAADLARVAQGALDVLGPEARPRRLTLERELRPAPVRGDRRLLERVAENLVENAVRHNVPGGTVAIATGVRDGAAWLRVASSGPELAPEELARLTEPFVRGERTRARGSGLGLAIVRTVTRAHGGTLELTPRPGGGLIAEIALPLRSPAGPAAAADGDGARGRSGRRARG